MKKLSLLIICLSLALFGGQPFHSWNFTKIVNGQVLDEGIGAPRLPYTNATLCSAQNGLNCPDGGYTFIVFPQKKLDFKELTFDVVFKLDSPLDKKKRAIISYEHTAWRQTFFILQFNHLNQLEARVCERKKDEALKEFVLTGTTPAVAPNVWHDVRVTLVSGGEGRLWLDGTLVDSRKNALSISDLSYSPKQYYPLLTFGTDPANPQQKASFLRGSIASVRMWNSIEEPNPLADTATETPKQQEKDNSSVLVTTDASAAEWTCPFNVLDFEGAAAGAMLTVDPKFVRCAGRASAALSGDKLVVSFKCLIPEGVDPKVNLEGGVWAGDAVEFFFRPDKTQSLYYHYGAGINGKLYAARMLAPRTNDTDFESKASVEVKHTPAEWDATFSIPVAEIGLNTAPGSVHTCNFTRSGPAAGGLQTWGPLATDFHQPDSFPTMIVGSRKAYFERRLDESKKALASLPPNAPELHQKALHDIGKLAETVAANGEKLAWYPRINAAFANLGNLFTSIVLEGRPFVLWEPDDPCGNSMAISMLSKPVEKIAITMPRNSETRRGFILTNMTDRPFLGQIKCFEKWPMQWSAKAFNNEPWNAFLGGIRFAEGLPIMDNAKNFLYDPLAPLPMNTVVRATPNGATPLWMTVSSKGLEPGVYTGKLVVKGDYADFGTQVADLEVTVTNSNPEDYPCVNMNFTYLLHRNCHPNHIRFLTDRGLNTIFAQLNGYYPEMNEDGTIGEVDYSVLDKIFSVNFANGFDKKTCHIIFYLAMEKKWTMLHNGKVRYPYGTPQFEKAFKLFLKDLASHLETTFGLRQSQLIFYPCDEPGGDWDDPKSTMNIAWHAGNWIKEALPEARRFIDPHPFSAKRRKLTDETMDKIFGIFDIVMLYRPTNTLPDVLAAAKKHNSTIWTYGILDKAVHASVYRRFYWQNLRDGIGSTAAFWHVDQHAGGDGFDSFDCSGYNPQNRTDYGTIYADVNYGTLLSGRRFDAWCDGFTDYRVAHLCLSAIEKRPDKEALAKQLQDIFTEGANGSIPEMEAARVKLLKFYEEVSK